MGNAAWMESRGILCRSRREEALIFGKTQPPQVGSYKEKKGSTVHVAVNGTHLVDLDAGQSYTGGVPPGHVTLTASLSWDIGQYKYEFNAAPGKSYAFELSRRVEHLAAGILFGLSGLVVETIASGEQSGEYKITPVE